MENLTFWVVLAFCVVGFIGSTVICHKVLKNDGVDLSGGFFKKIVMVIGSLGIIVISQGLIDGASSDEWAQVLPFGIGAIAVSLLILFFVNKSAVKPSIAIILSVFQVMYGVLIFLIVVLKLASRMAGFQLGGSSFDGSSIGGAKQNTYTQKVKKQGAVSVDTATNEQKDKAAQEMGYTSHQPLERDINNVSEGK